MENKLNYIENNHEENESKSTFDYKGVLIRSSVVILGILIILSFNNFYVGSLNPLQNNICYKDQLHDWTSGVNKYFQDNITPRNIMLIITGLLVDISMLTTFLFWIFKWTDWVIAYAIVLFYGVRGALILNIFQMTFPEGYNFQYPGFPSIAVCYLATNDFFYSGHIGFPIIFALEYNRKGEKYLTIPCLIISFLEGTMMVITRGHYSIDLIFGIIFAHYFYKIALLIDPWMNRVVCSICNSCSSSENDMEKLSKSK